MRIKRDRGDLSAPIPPNQTGTRSGTSVVQGAIEPYHGDVPEEPYVPTPYQSGRASVDDWRMLRPDSSGPIQDRYEVIVYPLRAVLLGALWLTAYWQRMAVFMLVIGAVVALFMTS